MDACYHEIPSEATSVIDGLDRELDSLESQACVRPRGLFDDPVSLFGAHNEPSTVGLFGSAVKQSNGAGGSSGTTGHRGCGINSIFGPNSFSFSDRGETTRGTKPSRRPGTLFGSTGASASPGLLGQPATSAISGRPLFGSTDVPSSGGLFGSSEPAPSSFLFPANHPTSSGGLFGSSRGSAPVAGNVSSDHLPRSNPGLFGRAVEPAGTTGGLFGSLGPGAPLSLATKPSVDIFSNQPMDPKKAWLQSVNTYESMRCLFQVHEKNFLRRQDDLSATDYEMAFMESPGWGNKTEFLSRYIDLVERRRFEPDRVDRLVVKRNEILRKEIMHARPLVVSMESGTAVSSQLVSAIEDEWGIRIPDGCSRKLEDVLRWLVASQPVLLMFVVIEPAFAQQRTDERLRDEFLKIVSEIATSVMGIEKVYVLLSGQAPFLNVIGREVREHPCEDGDAWIKIKRINRDIIE